MRSRSCEQKHLKKELKKSTNEPTVKRSIPEIKRRKIEMRKKGEKKKKRENHRSKICDPRFGEPMTDKKNEQKPTTT